MLQTSITPSRRPHPLLCRDLAINLNVLDLGVVLDGADVEVGKISAKETLAFRPGEDRKARTHAKALIKVNSWVIFPPALMTSSLML